MILSQIINGKRNTTNDDVCFEKGYDVIVCGLGTAGSLAALFCAENGLSVLGIEAFTCVGGTHTAGGVAHHYFDTPGGRYLETDEKVREFSDRFTCVPTDARKLLLEEELIKQGVEISYESTVCGVYLVDKAVTGVQVLTSEGFFSYGARIVMDCTGDAYVCAIAGCELEYGRKTDSLMQPYSLVSLIQNGEKFRHTNVDFGRTRQFDPEDLSRAICFARSYKMKEDRSGNEIVAQMPLLGIREGRRIKAEETARIEDLFSGKPTETPMFYAYADLDKHGWDIAFDGEKMGDWAIGANLGAYNVTVAVPYKALLPKGYEGLLVPCRALGVDRDISSAVRMIHHMKKAAEAAAEWASLAIRQEKTLREVSYSELKEKLVQSGCLKESDDRGYRVDGKRNFDNTPLIPRDVHWITSPEKLATPLATEAPGEAIRSALLIGKRAIPALTKLLDSEDEKLRKHSAFALATLGSEAGAEVLRDMVRSRDSLMLKDCRKNNNLRGCMAIYWLGRLEDREIAGELIRLICDEKEIERPLYTEKGSLTTRYAVSHFNNVYYQYLSQSVMALIRIGNRHGDLRGEIKKAFSDAFSTDAYYHRVTRRPRQISEGNMTLAIRNVAFSAIKQWN